MRGIAFFIFIFVVCAMTLSAGCVSSSGSQGNVTLASETGTAANTVSLASLAFTQADLPPGFTQVSGRQKSINELSGEAKDLGWIGGYVATYSSPGNETVNTTVVTQTITEYPAENIPNLVSLVNVNDRQIPGLSFNNLPSPSTGPETHAFSAMVNATTSKTENNPFLSSSPNTATTPSPEAFNEVVFGKGDILEVIRITGPGSQYSDLKTLAETAYKKLG